MSFAFSLFVLGLTIVILGSTRNPKKGASNLAAFKFGFLN